MAPLTLAALVLFVYYAVAFTKQLVGLLAKDPATSNWIVRVWALVLGVAGALGDYLLTASAYDRSGIYTEVKLGAAAAVVAIITYHVGQPGFVDPLDATDPATATVTVGPVTTTAPVVVTPTPETPTGGAL